MEYTLQHANEYIVTAKRGVVPTFRMEYHFMPPVGWMNDPNGLIYYGGKYHLFYQFYPYDTKNGPMHWGHFVSDDLVSYTDEEVVLAPNAEWESGCFSGGAEVDGGKLELVYTRHYDGETPADQRETVCLAESRDCKSFVKLAKPVFDNSTLPDNICPRDFRDPCPVKIGDRYYVLLGGKDRELNKGLIVVLSGKHLDSLEYDFTIGPYDELGEIAECPSYCKVDGKDVIIVSGVHVMERYHDFKNKWVSLFMVGELDVEGKRFDAEYIGDIDRGDTFYAPQFVRNAKRPTLIAWFETWGKRYPTRELGHGWVGAFTVPRELSYRNGRIYQTPLAALDKYKSPATANALPASADITASTRGRFTLTLAGDDGRIEIGSDGGRIYLDTRFANNQNGCIRHTSRRYDAADIRILLDVSGVEIFVDGGAETISSRYYISGGHRLDAFGGISDIKVSKIGVRK